MALTRQKSAKSEDPELENELEKADVGKEILAINWHRTH